MSVVSEVKDYINATKELATLFERMLGENRIVLSLVVANILIGVLYLFV